MASLPLPLYDELPPAARALHEQLTAERGRIDGMYQTLLNHPALLEKVAALGSYLRFEGSALPPAARELAILACARNMGAAYEWVKHVPAARQAGISGEILEDLRLGRSPQGLDATQQAVLRAAGHALARRSLPEPVQAALEKAYGVKGVVELVVLCGFYAMIAGVIFAFDIPLPEGERPPFGPGGGGNGQGTGRQEA